MSREGFPDEEHLQAQIAQKIALSPEDKHWLDNNANLVTETRTLDVLEAAPSYAPGLKRLLEEEKVAVERLLDVVKKPTSSFLSAMLLQEMT